LLGLQRIATLTPGFETALERPDVLDAMSPEKERHTGARGFVGSSTVENDFAIARQAVALFFQLLGVHSKGAGDGFGLRFEIHGMPQINDDEFLARIDFLFEFIHGNSRDAQLAKKALPDDEFVSDVS
jgi:hypothetical protein